MEKIKVTIKFFAYLRDYINDGIIEIDLVKGDTISHLMDYLCNTYKIRDKLFDNEKNLKSWVSILKNGREINFLEGLQTKLENGDEVAIFPPVAGG
ncbi:MAG: ubiquitin-like small modifier protein 1 [Candidatus Hermodarchaeota archaeon]